MTKQQFIDKYHNNINNQDFEKDLDSVIQSADVKVNIDLITDLLLSIDCAVIHKVHTDGFASISIPYEDFNKNEKEGIVQKYLCQIDDKKDELRSIIQVLVKFYTGKIKT